MGDVRFSRIYDRIVSASEPVRLLSTLTDEEVVQALAAASREHDPYLANVLGTEAMNRLRVQGTAVATMNEGLVVVDPNGCVTFMNPAAEHLLGWSFADIGGRRLHERVHAWDASGRPVAYEACRIMQDVLARRAVRAQSEVFTRRGGERIHVEYSSAPIVRDGVLEGSVLVFSDMTERRAAGEALRESEERYRSFFASHPDAIFSVAADARFVAINPAAEKISGYPAGDMLGKSFVPLVAAEDLDRVLAAFTRILAGATETLEFNLLRKDGKRAHVVVTGTPMRVGGKIVGLHGSAKDVTFEQGAKAALASRAMRQRFLAGLGEEALAAQDLGPVLDRGMRELASVLGVELTEILEFVRDRDELFLRAGYGWKEGVVGSATVGTGLDSQAGFTLSVRSPVVVADLATETRFNGPHLLTEHGVVSGMSVTIAIPGAVYGVLGVHTTKFRAFSTEDGDFLMGLANLLAFAIHRERTARSARENERKTQLLLDGARDYALILIDASGAIARWSAGAAALTGSEAREAEGQRFGDLFPQETRAEARGLLEEAARAGRRETEMLVLRTDGSRVAVEATITAIPRRGGFAVVMRDLTARTGGADALKRSKVNLEARARERARELAIANQDLEAFSYTVAHDLRAPLRGIEYFSGLLAEDHERDLGEEGREILARLRTEAARGSRLVSDLLDLAQVKRVPLAIEDLDLSAMAEDVAIGLTNREPHRRVRWSIEPGVRARGDPQLLRQVLDNLLGNAWKYTRGRPQPRIAFRTLRERGDHLFVVEDDGAGFDPRRAAELFKPFARLHTQSEFEGTGVGLAIVARIVERHGGRVEASSPGAGRGATVSFTLA